jgi:hypothetical protein
MNRIAMIAVLVGIGTAPALAFAASPSGNAPPANPPARNSIKHNTASTTQQHRMNIAQRANRETKALNMLEAKGYTDFTNFHRVRPSVFTASVDQHGHWTSVQVDPLDNQIMRG